MPVARLLRTMCRDLFSNRPAGAPAMSDRRPRSAGSEFVERRSRSGVSTGARKKSVGARRLLKAYSGQPPRLLVGPNYSQTSLSLLEYVRIAVPRKQGRAQVVFLTSWIANRAARRGGLPGAPARSWRCLRVRGPLSAIDPMRGEQRRAGFSAGARNGSITGVRGEQPAYQVQCHRGRALAYVLPATR